MIHGSAFSKPSYINVVVLDIVHVTVKTNTGLLREYLLQIFRGFIAYLFRVNDPDVFIYVICVLRDSCGSNHDLPQVDHGRYYFGGDIKEIKKPSFFIAVLFCVRTGRSAQQHQNDHNYPFFHVPLPETTNTYGLEETGFFSTTTAVLYTSSIVLASRTSRGHPRL